VATLPHAEDDPGPVEKLLHWASYGAVAAGEALVRDILRDARYADPLRLERCGRKLYSQNDEDGIIAEIFRRIGERSRRFVEIGVEQGTENNTLALLYGGWSGVWVEGVEPYVRAIRERFPRWTADGRLRVVPAIVTAENVDSLLLAADAGGEVDLLSIDIDGNDYYVLEALTAVRPRAVVAEYNARFAPPIRWRMPYDPGFRWDGSDHFGASLQSLGELMSGRGYALVGCNLTGNNAFFVRRELAQGKFQEPFDAANHYQPARYYLTSIFYGVAGGHGTNPRDDGLAS